MLPIEKNRTTEISNKNTTHLECRNTGVNHLTGQWNHLHGIPSNYHAQKTHHTFRNAHGFHGSLCSLNNINLAAHL